jgi:hypothetical protein
VPKVITSAMIIMAMNIFLFLLFSRIFKGIFKTFLMLIDKICIKYKEI